MAMWTNTSHALDDPTLGRHGLNNVKVEHMGPEEEAVAIKAAAHANTPTTVYLDTLGRPFLTMAHNRIRARRSSYVDETYATRVELDIEGNQREVRDAIVQSGDAKGRIVMRYDYDMLGNPYPPAQHGSRREVDAQRRDWETHTFLGQPWSYLPYRI